MRIHLHIERVLVHGLLPDGSAEPLRVALESGLARELQRSDPGMLATWLSSFTEAVRRTDIVVAPSPQAGDVGAAIATSLGRAMTSGAPR
jgi:hypothetical protein